MLERQLHRQGSWSAAERWVNKSKPKVCKSKNSRQCMKQNKVQLCQYKRGTYRDTCVSQRKARKYLESNRNYCGRCKASDQGSESLSNSNMCYNGLANDCETGKIQICHYSQRHKMFSDKCVSESTAKTYLKSGKDYCGKCKSTCDDNNLCTIDKWNKRTGTCKHEPITCPGGGRCSPTEGCLSKGELCRKSTNEFRTCYVRDQDKFKLAFPFEEPYIHQDERMVTGDMHLVLTEYGKKMNISCNDRLDLEELSIKYLKVGV